MVGSLLNGKLVSTQVMLALKQSIAERIKQEKRVPGLAVILVGSDPASIIYVNHKRKACQEVGIASYAYDLPYETQENELLALLNELNNAQHIDGILVQLPLPQHIDTNKIIERIHPQKDVDGFHPYNLGRLAQGRPWLRPCTPYGVIELLTHYQIDLTGQHCVIVGASNIVGRPMALECLLAKATVSICHRYTKHLESHIQQGDIIIIAIGNRNIIKPEWFNKNQIVVDIGIHRDTSGRLHGDVDFLKTKNRVAWITPVPGGVGPMTIAMLLKNTLLAAENSDAPTLLS